MVRREPYLSMFGWSELRGVWNPWAENLTLRHRAKGYGIGHDASSSDGASRKEGGSTGAKETEAPKMSHVAQTKASKSQASEEGEYTFDPITMRKIKIQPAVSPEKMEVSSRTPKAVASEQPKAGEAKQSDAGPFAIPVKPPPTRMTDLSKDEIEALKSSTTASQLDVMGFARQPWLSKEWSQTIQSRPIPRRRMEANGEPSAPLQSSLDRMTAAQKDAAAQTNSSEPAVPVGALDSKKSAETPSWTPRSSVPSYRAPSKTETREKLDKDYFASQARFDEELAAVQKPRDQQKQAVPPKRTAGDNTKPQPKPLPPSSLASEISDELNMASKWVKQSLTEALQAFGEAKKLLKEAKDEALKLSLDEEVNSQKAAMSSFESKPREPTKNEDSPPATETAWRKLEDDMKQMRGRRQKDSALVREIRDIYEEKYGKISTEHRQPQATSAAEEPRHKDSNAGSGSGAPSPARDPKANREQGTKGAQSATTATSESRETNKWLASSSPFAVDKPPPTRPGAQTTDHASARLTGVDDIHPQRPIARSNVQPAHGERAKPLVADDIQPQESTSYPSSSNPSAPVSGPSRTPASAPRLHRPRKQVVYKVLAYDAARDEVSMARTSSSLYERSKSLQSPSWILSHLETPHKYLDVMETLEATGYELVAGDRKMLVYRQVKPEDPEVEELKKTSAAVAKASSAAPFAPSEVIQPLREHHARSASSEAFEKPASAQVQREDARKMQSLHDHLRRLEKQQRGMEVSSNTVANRLQSLEMQIQRLVSSRPQGPGPVGERKSRLRRTARFLFRIPLVIARMVAWAALAALTVIVTCEVVTWLYVTLRFWWITGRLPRERWR